jgi:hypothetical protein
MINVRKISVNEIFGAPECGALLAEYDAESNVKGIQGTKVDPDAYRALERAGLLTAFGAYRAGALVGFLTLVTIENHKYRDLISSIESVFVGSSSRTFGTADKLIKAAQEEAVSRGAMGMLISSPTEGRLARAVSMWGFAPSHKIFFKPLREHKQALTEIPKMSAQQIDRVFAFEKHLEETFPPEPVDTHVVINGGMCARTVYMRAGTAYTGSVIKVPSVITLCGHCRVHNGDVMIEVKGYNTFPAAAGRKQALVAIGDTVMTMTFATNAKTIEEAEQEAVEDTSRLASNNGNVYALVAEVA